MSLKNQNAQNEEPEEIIEAAIGRTEFFLFKNGKILLISLGVIFVIVSAFFGTKYMYTIPREGKAAAAAFAAEQQFARDSFAMALNGYTEGDISYAGFLDVIDQYGSTKIGNTSNHYAGICYLQLGDYDNALKYLASYKVVDGIAAAIINTQNLGLQGDVYSLQGKTDEALKMYEKASSSFMNELTTPYYLKKMALVYEKNGNTEKALEAYTKIKDQYSFSFEARDIDKYIGRLSLK